MIEDNDWYFDHITEDIIFGNIDAGNNWVVMCRKLKKKSVIRKYANDKRIKTDDLPEALGKVVDRYRKTHQIQGSNNDAHI